MLRWALIFLIIALVAALFGFTGIAAAAAGIAKFLFFLFLVVCLILFVCYRHIGRQEGSVSGVMIPARLGKSAPGWEHELHRELRRLPLGRVSSLGMN